MSNETTLDDVLALVAKWREPQAGDECTLYTMGKRESRNVCADELKALLPAIKAALEDARRWQAARQFIGAKEIEDWEKMAAGGHIASEAGNRWADEAIDAAQEVGK